MSAQANIIAFDGAATPVSHTLTPDGNNKTPDGESLAVWSEKIATLPEYAQVRVRQSKKKLKSGLYRIATVVEVPVMESILNQNAAGYTAAPAVAFVDSVHIVQFCSQRSTILSRRLVRQLALNIGGGIATSVAPVITGPAAELHDQLVISS